MKIKIEEVMGDQKFVIPESRKINLSNSAAMPKIIRFRSIIHAEGKCDAGSSDEKHSKLNAESNDIISI
jgi:hypothetical protein